MFVVAMITSSICFAGIIYITALSYTIYLLLKLLDILLGILTGKNQVAFVQLFVILLWLMISLNSIITWSSSTDLKLPCCYYQLKHTLARGIINIICSNM